MSISNHLCGAGEGPPRVYFQYWVPVRQNLGAGGVYGAIDRLRNGAMSILKGGSPEEHRLFAELMKELKADAENMKTYVKDGTVEAHLDALIKKIMAYEKEYHDGHPEHGHMKSQWPSANANFDFNYYPRPPHIPPVYSVGSPWAAVPCSHPVRFNQIPFS